MGDKITLPLAPLVAVFGVAVPQLSGRGLGHTGGTLDKLESIPGWRAALSNEEMLAQLQDVGAVICAAGAGLAPADKKLYALRDVTGTVEAIPLIASSIMSKKIAEGTGSLVLDVKVGSGAFMKDEARARELAETMVALGKDAGVNTVALLTNMNTPAGPHRGQRDRGRGIGGGPRRRRPGGRRRTDGPAGRGDARLRRRAATPTRAAALRDGRAMDVWNRMIEAQGGDPRAPSCRWPRNPRSSTRRPTACWWNSTPWPSAWRPGGSAPDAPARRTQVQAGAGVRMHAKPGATVRAGEPLMTLLTDTPRGSTGPEALRTPSYLLPRKPAGPAADHRPHRVEAL